MNKYFDFKRFIKLFTTELSEKIHFILKFAAVLCLIMIAFWLLGKLLFFALGAGFNLTDSSARVSYITFSYFLTALLAPFALYKNINHPKKGVDYAILPASINEKFVSMLVNTVIVAPLIIFISLITINFLTIFIGSFRFGESLTEIGVLFNQDLFDIIISVLGVQALFIFGNTFFMKSKAIKTIMFVALFYIMLVIIGSVLMHSFGFKDPHRIMENPEIYKNFVTYKSVTKWLVLGLQFCFILFSYIRFKTLQYK